MKSIKYIKTINDADKVKVNILFEDGREFIHEISRKERDEIHNCDNRYIENLIAKYSYRDKHSVVRVERYLNNKGKICIYPSGQQCGQCKFFQQNSVYYSEISMGCPNTNSTPYPVGTCTKHGFGPCLSAYRTADGSGCGWEIAGWCHLDDRELTKNEEEKLRDVWE